MVNLRLSLQDGLITNNALFILCVLCHNKCNCCVRVILSLHIIYISMLRFLAKQPCKFKMSSQITHKLSYYQRMEQKDCMIVHGFIRELNGSLGKDKTSFYKDIPSVIGQICMKYFCYFR